MIKSIFNKGKKEVEQAATTKPEMVFSGKPSKKKKNTYVLFLSTMTMPGAFELCDTTPLVVVKINGKETQNAHGGFMNCTQFPNPGACQTEVLWHRAPEWRIIFGEKRAQTIIEYLDKFTNEPVLLVYPNGHVQSLVANEDVNTVAATRLNHASRRDLQRQFGRIKELVDIVNPMIRVRNEAMRHAPQYSQEAYAQFVAELDQEQIKRAKQIVAARQK